MGINVHWQDEGGGQLAAVDDDRSTFSHIIQRLRDDRSVCLRFIDPWGDTTFNQLQIPVLIEELECASAETNAREEREQIALILHLAHRSVGVTHTYLRFIGD